MKVYLIRHGATRGNLEHRYVGSTDEELDLKGRIGLEEKFRLWKQDIDSLYVSPLKRCRQTAEILYPGNKQIVVEDLKECSFGEFEYRNYQELNGNPDYQKFIDTMGACGFPGGETLADFQNRCVKAFRQVMEDVFRQESQQREQSIAFVVHGGTIMAILDKFSVPHKDYYEWQAGNGEGFSASVLRDGESFYLEDVKKLWQ